MDFQSYYNEVAEMALSYGYDENVIKIFKEDISDCFYEGKTVEECVLEIF